MTLITLITLVAPSLKAIVTYVTVKSVYFLHRSPCASLKPFNCQLCCHNSSTGFLSVIFVLLYNTLSSKCIATCLADQPVYFSSTSQCAPLEPLNYSRDCHNCSRHATIWYVGLSLCFVKPLQLVNILLHLEQTNNKILYRLVYLPLCWCFWLFYKYSWWVRITSHGFYIISFVI